MSTIEKVSYKSDIEQQIQNDRKYRQKRQVIADTINQLQYKKEADQA